MDFVHEFREVRKRPKLRLRRSPLFTRSPRFTEKNMNFDLDSAVPVLARTPAVLRELLSGLPHEWMRGSEGPDTWTIREILVHLTNGEQTDWIPRARHILAFGADSPFPPFDRTAGFAERRELPIDTLLEDFADSRRVSLDTLAALELTAKDLAREGRHPEFGRVTLAEHLATWVAHDLTHLSQIVRVMAAQYRDAVGPWAAYLRVVRPLSS
jgi:hypothetical protein